MGRRRSQKVVLRCKKKSVIKKRFRKTFFSAAAVIVLALISYAGIKYLPGFIENSDFLRINDIIIHGVDEQKREVIKNHMAGWKNASYLTLNRKSIYNDLNESFPEFKILKCSYSIGGMLSISLKKRAAAAFTRHGGQDYYIDSEGQLFVCSEKQDVPEIYYYDDEGKNAVLMFISICEQENLKTPLRIEKIFAKDFSELDVFLEDGTKIAWGAFEPDIPKVKEKYERLNVVLEHAFKRFGRLKYVNLRYLDDGRILIRPESKLSKS